MSSSEEAKSLLKPIFDKFCKIIEEQKWDEAAAFYDEEAALVETGKKGVHGREAIKQEFLKFAELVGKVTFKVLSEHYQMTTNFIILDMEFETTSEKKGVEKGKSLQIWKKKGDTYLLYHEEFSVA